MSAGSASFTNWPSSCGTDESKRASGPDRVEHRQLFLLGDLAVHLAERGREVDDPRPFVDGDEVGDHDPVGAGIDGEVVERPLVPEAGEIGHGDRLDDLDVFAEHVGDARRGEDEVTPAAGRLHAHVLDLGPDRGGDVRDERPRRGRPHEKVEVGADHGEPDVDRWLGHVLVRARLAQLVARQRSAASTAVRHDLEALVDEVAVPHLADQPPDALDVLVVRGSSTRPPCRSTSRCEPSAPTSPRRSAGPTRGTAG